MMDLSPCKDNTVDVTCFKELLLQTCGHKFEHEREQALAVAIDRRMSALGIRQPGQYHARLLCDDDELLQLTELLTVNETYFFREPDHLDLMVDLLPQLLAGRGHRRVRIVSAGCSTGEEPYSIAMLLRERFGADSERLFAITGVDIDSQVIAAAKQGMYGESSFRGIHNALVDRYFQPCGAGKFKLSETICKQVEFEMVNLLGPAYPPRMQMPDIILYRNVSIYFPAQVQQLIFRKLADLLVEGGCLLVGATETMHHDLSILTLVQKGALFYYRKATGIVDKYRKTQGKLTMPPELERRNKPVAVCSGSGPMLHQAVDRLNWPFNPSLSGTTVNECYKIAHELARNQQADEAIALLDAIIARDASLTKAYTLKAHLLLNASRWGELVATCLAALDHNSLCSGIYLMLGMAARQQGDDEVALKRLREALFLDAACWLAHFHSAEIYYSRGDEKKARSSYEAATRIMSKVADKAMPGDLGRDLLPLAFNMDQFAVICQHKLSLLSRKKFHRNGI